MSAISRPIPKSAMGSVVKSCLGEGLHKKCNTSKDSVRAIHWLPPKTALSQTA